MSTNATIDKLKMAGYITQICDSQGIAEQCDIPAAPTGTLDVTENGEYDVTAYAGVNVTVQGAGGSGIPANLISISAEDLIDLCTFVCDQSKFGPGSVLPQKYINMLNTGISHDRLYTTIYHMVNENEAYILRIIHENDSENELIYYLQALFRGGENEGECVYIFDRGDGSTLEWPAVYIDLMADGNFKGLVYPHNYDSIIRVLMGQKNMLCIPGIRSASAESTEPLFINGFGEIFYDGKELNEMSPGYNNWVSYNSTIAYADVVYYTDGFVYGISYINTNITKNPFQFHFEVTDDVLHIVDDSGGGSGDR